jgi:imidazolonepropionase-like amidohydrolase
MPLAAGVGVESGACVGEMELPPADALQAATRRPSISIQLARAAGRTSARMVG